MIVEDRLVSKARCLDARVWIARNAEVRRCNMLDRLIRVVSARDMSRRERGVYRNL